MIMGVRTELAAGDGFDWTQQDMVKSSTGGRVGMTARPVRPPPQQQQKQRQQQAAAQQQGPQPRCPRCDSTNTKFCYFNNYSRTQPRHFCKACRRHWTEGGTLRNVPVGGGRKAKRPKTSHPSSAVDPAAADDANTVMPAASAQLLPRLSLPPDHLLSSALLPSSLPPPSAYANTSYLSAFLSLPPIPGAAGVVDGSDGYSFASAAFSPFLSLTGQEDMAAGIASDTGISAGSMATPPPPPPWELLPPPPPGPPTCSGGASGSSVTTASSGLTALDSSSSPSSGYWGRCWEDLSSFLSIDLEQHPLPASDAPPQHLYNFELS